MLVLPQANVRWAITRRAAKCLGRRQGFVLYEQVVVEEMPDVLFVFYLDGLARRAVLGQAATA